MNRNDCEAVLHLHRTFLPRRRTGRGFLTGTVFLNAALLFCAFVLATAHFVRKPGLAVNLPVSAQSDSIQFNDLVLNMSREGLCFFNDEPVSLDRLESVLQAAAIKHPGAALIFEAAETTPLTVTTTIYDAAARAGFRQVFIATRSPAPATPLAPAP